MSLANQYQLPLIKDTAYNFTVFWGDGTSEIVNITANSTASNSPVKTYTNIGEYQISIYENVVSGFPGFSQTQPGWLTEKIHEDVSKIKSIDSFGTIQYGKNWDYFFDYCFDLTFKENDISYAKTNKIVSMLRTFNKTTTKTFPLINTSSVENFSQTWYNCNKLSSFPLINTSKGIDFTLTWGNCYELQSFPSINTPKATRFHYTWMNCSKLTAFPLIDTSNATTMNGVWSFCEKLSTFPLINTSNVSSNDIGGFHFTWRGCASLSSFPLIDTSKVKLFSGTWSGCKSLISFPLINTSNVVEFRSTWNGCTSLTSFPLIDTFKAIRMGSTWEGCSNLISFPQINTSNNTIFDDTWRHCGTITEFPILNMNKMERGISCFENTTIPTSTYSAILTSLCAFNPNNNVTFHGGNSKYFSTAQNARDYLTSTKMWVLSDGGLES